MGSPQEFIGWLFKQHVDHRIPIQKAVHTALAQASEYDMRSLMIFNASFALATATLLIKAVGLSRNALYIGDALIPLIMLNPASGNSLWAMHLQFLSSILFISLATHQWLVFGRTRKKRNLVVWLAWSPSTASKQVFSLQASITTVIELIPASIFAFAPRSAAWNSIAIALLTLAALWLLMPRWRALGLSLSDIVLSLVICASMTVIIAVAAGRAGTEHLIVHDGNLTLLLPITAWMVLSTHGGRLGTMVITPLVLFLFVASYLANFEWRSSPLAARRQVYANINSALHHETDPSKIIRDFPEEFPLPCNSFLARKRMKTMTRGIETLRRSGYPNYALQ